MKRISLIVLLSIVGLTYSFGQGTLGKGGKQVNAGFGFSSFGVPVYVGADFGVHEDITIGPRISFRTHNQTFVGTRFSQNLTVVSFNGNYHFNTLLELPGEWDLYAGLTIGYNIWSDNDQFSSSRASGAGLDGQIGGRYFFTERFGVNLEFGGGYSSGGFFGITYKL